MATVGLNAQPAWSQVVQLEDGNSSVRLNFTPSTPSSIFDIEQADTDDEWRIDGVDNLFVEDIFFNFGLQGNRSEVSLGEFTLTGFSQSAANQANLSFLYAPQNLEVLFQTSLFGGDTGTNSSSRTETLTLRNLNPDRGMSVSLYRYFDFDISGQFGNDTTRFIDRSNLVQSDSSGLQVQLTSQQPPNRVALAEYPFLLADFADLSRTNLDNDITPLVNTDGTAAFQFNRILAPEASAQFDFTMSFTDTSAPTVVEPDSTSTQVPEPAVGSGIVVMIGGYLLRNRRRQTKRR